MSECEDMTSIFGEEGPGINQLKLSSDLDKAFKELKKMGFLALQDHWCCKSCGCGDLEDSKKWCFFHRQDLETIFEGKGSCYLTFGGSNNCIDKKVIEIGNEIMEIFNKCNLEPEWDKNPMVRIRFTI